MNTLGVDIGGTKIYVARYNAKLEVEAETKVATDADKQKKQTLRNLLTAINKVRDENTQSIGMAWAGFVDTKKGVIVKAPNVPQLNNFALCDYITKETGLPSFIENDARAFAFGARAKLAPESKMCLGIIIGTGVGSGLIYNGEILKGAHGYAGEIGHMIIQQKEVEMWLSGPALKKHLGLNDTALFSEILPDRKQNLLPHLENNLSVFASWLSGLVVTFDPDQIILGGGTACFFWQHFETEIIQATNILLKGYPNTFKLSFYYENNAGAAGVAALSSLR